MSKLENTALQTRLRLDEVASSPEEELLVQWLQDLTKLLVVWVNDRGSHSTTCRQVYQWPTV